MVAAPQMFSDFHLSTSVIRTESELQSLRSEWKSLFRRAECTNVFLTFEWLSQWWLHFGQGSRLFLVTVRESEGRLIAVAPLYISTRRKTLSLRRLGLLGDLFVGSDHLDVLVERGYEPRAIESLANFILGRRNDWDFIELSGCSPDSLVLTQFQNTIGAKKMATYQTDSSLCPYLQLPRTSEEYWSSLRPRHRKNLRYYNRLLQREGEVTFVTVEDSKEMESSLDELLRLHQLRSERRGRHSTFADLRVAPFHQAALKSLAQDGKVRIFFLELSGKRVAALYGFSTGKKFFYYQSGTDPAYGRFSVGNLLLNSVIEWAIQTGHSEFDFLRGDESYKRLWATEARQLHDLSLFDRRARGRLAQTVRLVRHFLHQCKAKLLRKTTSNSNGRAPVVTSAS